MTAALRVGLLGAGWIGAAHAAVIDADPALALAAVCDVDPARAAALAGPRGARVHARWEGLLDDAIDVLWVCTPPLHHRAPTVAALGRGLPVYLEKPIARDVADGQAIVAAAHASGAVCAVGYQWQATALVAEARRLLAGRPVALLVSRNIGPTAARPWFTTMATGGGQVLERASHHVQLQRSLAGEVVEVEAHAAGVRLAQAGGPAGDVDDALALVLRFASGALGTIHVAWTTAGQPGVFGLDVAASDATLSLDLGGALRLHGDAGGAAVDVADGQAPMARSAARLVAAVRAGDPQAVACTPADALATLAVAVACEEALASGGRVAVRG